MSRVKSEIWQYELDHMEDHIMTLIDFFNERFFFPTAVRMHHKRHVKFVAQPSQVYPTTYVLNQAMQVAPTMLNAAARPQLRKTLNAWLVEKYFVKTDEGITYPENSLITENTKLLITTLRPETGSPISSMVLTMREYFMQYPQDINLEETRVVAFVCENNYSYDRTLDTLHVYVLLLEVAYAN